jgi:hypothetical protein
MPSRHLGVRARALAATTLLALVALPAAAQAAAPDTQLAGPWVTRSSKAAYTLSATVPGSSFQCSVNWSAWTACSSPATLTLASGANDVRVRAVGPAGEVDATPAEKWTQVDTTAPTVTVQGLTDAAVVSSNVSVTAAGRDAYAFATLELWLDGVRGIPKDFGSGALTGTLARSIDPATLAGGAHTLHVRAVDRAGNATDRAVQFTTQSASTTTAPGRLFGPDSFWNQPLADSAPLDPRDAEITGGLVQEVNREIAAGTGPWINAASYSTPLYTVAQAEARVPVILDGMAHDNPLYMKLAAGVPIPAGALAARGTDAHLTVWQPSKDTLWELWGAVKQADGWHARYGGILSDVSTGPGHYRDRRDASGATLEQKEWGSTATSLPAIGGTVTVAEARAGRIDHALAIAVPTACVRTFSWPAQRTDGSSTAPACLPLGARLRLDPALDLSTMAMPRFTRMLAVAAQTYGIVVRDTTGSVVSFFGEDPAQYGSDLWYGTNGTNGLLLAQPWDLVQTAFPWSRLELLQMSLNA